MGIGASTNVKEIRIDQKDAKWGSYPSSSSSRQGSKNRTLGRRWINSAETTANTRRLLQLNNALESAEKRAQTAEQRMRQLERELAALELRNMELAEEAAWLRKQLSDRPEAPMCQRPPTGTQKFVSASGSSSTGTDSSEAYRNKQNQYVTKLESQIKLYEEDILKLKTKMSKETQRLQAELEDQKHRSEKEVRSLDNHLIEAHKLNQKYEDLIIGKISADAVTQIRKEVLADFNSSCAGTITAAAAASSSSTFGLDSLSQSKSRAQLILELTEQISVQQDKIRELEEEIVQRDMKMSRFNNNSMIETDGGTREWSPHRCNGTATVIQRTAGINGANSSKKSHSGESSNVSEAAPASSSTITIVANEDEIEALLNNPRMMYESDEENEQERGNHGNEGRRERENHGNLERKERGREDHGNEERKGNHGSDGTQETGKTLSTREAFGSTLNLSHDSHYQRSETWRKGSMSRTVSAAAGLPPSGKRIMTIDSGLERNNTSANTVLSRPKTVATHRQRFLSSTKRKESVDEGRREDGIEGANTMAATRQTSLDGQMTPNSGRIHSAPMFSFKPRPSSKQTIRSNLVSAICGGELPPPIDLEDTSESPLHVDDTIEPPVDVEHQGDAQKQDRMRSQMRRASSRLINKDRESIEILSLHGQESVLSKAGSEMVTSGYDSSAAIYDDEGDVEDVDDDGDDENSDQEIRRRFEERWRKSTTDPTNVTGSNTDTIQPRPRMPRPPSGGAVGRARERLSAKSQDSGFLGDSSASTSSLSVWKGRNRRGPTPQHTQHDPLDVDKLLGT